MWFFAINGRRKLPQNPPRTIREFGLERYLIIFLCGLTDFGKRGDGL
jgi:hypothetical protein